MFPVIHVGRIWLLFYFIPYQIQRVLYGSILTHHFFGTFCNLYIFYSFAFVFGTRSGSWLCNAQRQSKWFRRRNWHNFLSLVGQVQQSIGRFESLSLVLAGLATPLGTFSTCHRYPLTLPLQLSRMAHYHFPPYFVAVFAIFSGFAMVQTLMLVTRKALKTGRLHYNQSYWIYE